MNPQRRLIVFEDTHLAVVEKPAGLLSQSDSSGGESLVDLLRGHFGRNYVGLIHRLDRNTSGLMVVGKRSKSADRLSEQLRDGRLERRYLALLEGSAGAVGDRRTLKNWLVKNEATNITRALPHGPKKPHPDAKEAELRMEVLRQSVHHGIPITRAEFTLQTGRSHQIRAQAAFAGFPLAGDLKYGSRHAGELGLTHPALHSHYLAFEHPMTGERLEFRSECPAGWPIEAPSP
jgi:23S rRNA pseudouridine1911/1915/1917 synthase